jgi:hypothetical protein
MIHHSSFLSALVSSSFCQTFTAISQLYSAGCQLLQNLHGCIHKSHIAVISLGVFWFVWSLTVFPSPFAAGSLSLFLPWYFVSWEST